MLRRPTRTAKAVTWHESTAEVCTAACRAEAHRDRTRTQALAWAYLPR